MRIGILHETKVPPDRRVAFTPDQVGRMIGAYSGLEVVVQPSPIRCYQDGEYAAQGAVLSDDLSGCDLIFGVKEVDPSTLIPGKTYLFFSHTAKEQPYNRGLLQEAARRGITLVDYEYLARDSGERVVAFGRWAGLVGAYNGLRGYGERYRTFRLKPAHECRNLEEMFSGLPEVALPGTKILVTGGGRVAGGAMETLGRAGIREVKPEAFLQRDYDEAVVCRIDPWHYVRRRDGSAFDPEHSADISDHSIDQTDQHKPAFDLGHFFSHPELYESTFKPYTRVTDLMVACHYWDPRSPVFMTLTDMREPRFRIEVIADVSCDLNGPIPSTIRTSTIAEPFYGFDARLAVETGAFDPGSITVMAVDNLPGELPRNASEDFGNMLLKEVVPSLLEGGNPEMIDRASILVSGRLNRPFAYLRDYLEGK